MVEVNEHDEIVKRIAEEKKKKEKQIQQEIAYKFKILFNLNI